MKKDIFAKENYSEKELFRMTIAETCCNEEHPLDSFESHDFYTLYANKTDNIPFSPEDVIVTKSSFQLDYLPKGILIRSVGISINNTDFPDVYIFYEDENIIETFTDVYHSKTDNTISFFCNGNKLSVDVNIELKTSKDLFEIYFFNIIKCSEKFRDKMKTRILFPKETIKKAFEDAGDTFPDLYDR